MITAHSPAGYLEPVLGCLRRNRRRLFAAAVTRYLKSVYTAVVADIGDFPRRQANDRPATEGDEGGGRKVAGSGAISARDLACNQGTPGHRWQADPARRAACGPSTGSGAAEAPFQHVGTATESDEVSVARGRPAREPVSVRELWVSAGRCGGDMSTPQKCPSTRDYLKQTSDNRRSGRPADRPRLCARRARWNILSATAGIWPGVITWPCGC